MVTPYKCLNLSSRANSDDHILCACGSSFVSSQDRKIYPAEMQNPYMQLLIPVLFSLSLEPPKHHFSLTQFHFPTRCSYCNKKVCGLRWVGRIGLVWLHNEWCMPSLLSDGSFPLVVQMGTTVATLLLVTLRLPTTTTRCFCTSVVSVQPPLDTTHGWRAFERNLIRFSHAISICHLCKYLKALSHV